MAVNPYTLNHLYQHGILDYVPADLMMGTPVGSILTPMNNPYMNMAQQGALYQNHGMASDSFHSSYTPAYTPNDYQSVSNSSNAHIGAHNYNGYNNGMVQIGVRSNAGGLNTFNGYGIGSRNNNGLGSAVGEYGNVGMQTNAGGLNTFGGFGDTRNNISDGIDKVSNAVNNTPKLLLGFVAATVGIIGLASLFKRSKKPSKTTTNTTNFLSKLNPMNWFKKNK